MTTVLTPTQIPDVERILGIAAQNLLGDLLQQLWGKRRRNQLRADYYDLKNAFRDLGIAIPPHLRNLEVAMGWPAKAVDQLARRVHLNGFVLPDGDVADFGIPELWTDNQLASLAPQGTVSSLIHATSFLMTTRGDTDLGEPEIVMSVHDAFSATGMWDTGRRGLSSALVVMDPTEHAERFLFFTPVAWADIRRSGSGWEVRAERHDLGRVPVEPLAYRPRLGRPFGSSRISRAVMSITNSAMRTVVRSEVSAEFFSSPQRYILGADESMFVDESGNRKSVWDLIIGHILAVPADDEESKPEVNQFPATSMTPHTEHLRMWATMFAGETSLPVSSLGIVQDNPASAEAIYAAKEDLILEAEGTCDGFTPPWVRSMITGVQLRDGLSAVPPQLRALDCRWRDPSTPSRAAATDAVMKQVSAGVLPPDSPVALEQLGYDQTTIDRIMADRRRAAGRNVLQSLVAGQSTVQQGPESLPAGPAGDLTGADLD